MSYPVAFHPQVESDASEAYHWYELQQKGLGERFLANVYDTINIIKQSPETFGAKSRKHYREAMVRDFPYLIVYRFYPGKNEILSVRSTMQRSILRISIGYKFPQFFYLPACLRY